MHTGELPTILYGSFAYLLLHDPYLWVKNWMPTVGNTTGGSMSAANAINPVFSLAVSSCGRDIISSQVDRDAYLMDVGKLPADMSLMPTSQLIENDQLEVPSANVLLRMTRKTLEAARLKLESLIQEIHSHKEQFDHGMSLAVALYNLRTAQNAGLPYIHLPLQAMARRLESLRDTLAAQLDGVTKVLRFSGDSQGNMAPSSPAAPFVSGGGKMVHLNALPRSILNNPRNEEQWRPQRGLPERAVTLLRTWLFENFLHPYPKDSDKQLLARRTGLSRNQVSNWFINARVRLWKPMVEDMCEVDPKLEDVAMLQRDETGDALEVGPQFVHFAHPAEHFTGAPGNNHQVVELQNGSLVPVPHSAGNQVGMFQGLNPGSQSRTSWRADTHMRPEMQTWITIASGAHQHEQRSVVQSRGFTFSQQHLSNPVIPGAVSNPAIPGALSNPGCSGAMTVPLQLGLSEPRNPFQFFNESGQAPQLPAELNSTAPMMRGTNQGTPPSMYVAVDSQNAATVFGSSTLEYSWNHQRSITLSLSNPENLNNFGLPLGAAFPDLGLYPTSGFDFTPNPHHPPHDPSAAAEVSLTLGLQLRNSDIPADPETTESLPLLDSFNPGFPYNTEMPPGFYQ